jgi:hypothetical protein
VGAVAGGATLAHVLGAGTIATEATGGAAETLGASSRAMGSRGERIDPCPGDQPNDQRHDDRPDGRADGLLRR